MDPLLKENSSEGRLLWQRKPKQQFHSPGTAGKRPGYGVVSEINLKHSSLVKPAFHFDLPPVVFHHLPDHIQPDARAFHVGVQTLEHLEHFVCLGRGYPQTVVFHTENDKPAFPEKLPRNSLRWENPKT
jgi:hypothetical protein